MRQPTLGPKSVVFCLGGELWRVPRTGGSARRLEFGPGVKSCPCFSPDGLTLAFACDRNGDRDVYVAPAEGGEARRLTYHPSNDEPVGWTPDGRKVLFRSWRDAQMPVPRLFTISEQGGPAEAIPLPIAREGSFSPDGLRLAYVPMDQWQPSWRGYRGGQTLPIWIADLKTKSVWKLPRPSSNDHNPMWTRGSLYFLSDRDGGFGLYVCDVRTKRTRCLVSGAGFDIQSASAGPDGIVFARLGSLGLYDLTTRRVRPVPVRIEEVSSASSPRSIEVGKRIDAAALNPAGDLAAFQARGEILTLSSQGECKILSNTPAAMERDAAFAPDGRAVAFFSDEGGAYRLCVRNLAGTETRRFRLGPGDAIPAAPVWSPDGRRIAYRDSRLRLWCLNLGNGRTEFVDANPKPYQPGFDFDCAWSPDGRWLAYARPLNGFLSATFVYAPEERIRRRVTFGLADVRMPVFERDGRFLYVTASTDSGPSEWFPDMTSVDRAMTRRIFAIALTRAGDHPIGAIGPVPRRTEIEFTGIEGRAHPLPIPARRYQSIASAGPGRLLTVSAPDRFFPFGQVPLTVSRFEVASGEEIRIADEASGFWTSATGERGLLRRGDEWRIVPTDRPAGADALVLAVDRLRTNSVPLAEWRQMYHEAWRIVRESFYDPRFHGIDLAAEERRYQPFLQGLRSREDLNFLFETMLGDLRSSHVSAGDGDVAKFAGPRCGTLGADFQPDHGHYRFTKIYDEGPWNAWPLAPLTQSGASVRSGEYLLSVDGRRVDLSDEVYRWFEGKAGIKTTLEVGPRPDGVGSRRVQVVPLSKDDSLRRNAWIEVNRRLVDRLSGGRLAYVYLPNTHLNGKADFDREFFAQTGKAGLIVDARFNGGGFTPDYFLDYLRRTEIGGIVGRFPGRVSVPSAGVYGPKALVINALAGSGGDALAWMWRLSHLGLIVGKRTMGGLRSVMGSVPLMDGGYVSVPQLAFVERSGASAVENVGVTPNFDVELEPASYANGRDLQLEKAVAVALRALKADRSWPR